MKSKGLALIFGKPSSSKKGEGYEDMEDMEDSEDSEEENEEYDAAVDELIVALEEKNSDAIKKYLKKAIKSCEEY